MSRHVEEGCKCAATAGLSSKLDGGAFGEVSLPYQRLLFNCCRKRESPSRAGRVPRVAREAVCGVLSSRHGASDRCVIVVALLSVPERFVPPLSLGARAIGGGCGRSDGDDAQCS